VNEPVRTARNGAVASAKLLELLQKVERAEREVAADADDPFILYL
jgi:hypothetical protein